MGLFKKTRPTGAYEPWPSAAANQETAKAVLSPSGPYTGPRCFVSQDEYAQKPDGSYEKTLEGGWHYSTKLVTVKHRVEVQAEGEQPEVREWEVAQELPDRKLHLNDEHKLESEWVYEYAEPHHKSWQEKHGVGQLVPLEKLDGEHPDEAHDEHPLHSSFHSNLGSRPGRRAE